MQKNLIIRLFNFVTHVAEARKREGYLFALRFIISSIHYKILRILALPPAIILILLRPFIKIRFLPVSCLTIGHYSLSIEVLLCNVDKLIKKNNKDKIIYLQRPKAEVCNVQLYSMWKRIIPFSPDLLYPLCSHIELYLERWFGTHLYKNLLGQASHDRWDILENSKQHLKFTEDELDEGKENLLKMGIPKDGQFICLIVRDEAHYQSNSNYTNMSAYRNADILSYKKAALFLADKGYYVIRMGKTVTKSFDVGHERVIDYACSQFRSDFMDIYLSAHCYFFMSTLCGLDGIAHAFRRPILATNITPHAYYHLGYPIKLFLAKKVKSKKTGDFISFKKQREIFNLGSHHHFIHQRLNEYSLEIIPNTEDEILNVTKEMFYLMQGDWEESESKKILQNEYINAMWQESYINQEKITEMPMCKYKPKYSTNDLLSNPFLIEKNLDFVCKEC